jgi:hypothetical protein
MLQGEHADRGSDLYGTVTQHLNIEQQLNLGIRAFQLKVAWAPHAHRLYASHNNLVMPLHSALVAIQRFLEAHSSEIVIIHAAKDMEVLTYNTDEHYMKVLLDEEMDSLRIPGQLVHTEVLSVFGDMLATYVRLAEMPSDEILENPTIATCQQMNIRVFYFWEGQQVVCTDIDACHQTPGWTASPSLHALPFGPPLQYGQRQAGVAATVVSGAVPRTIEPNCIFNSEDVSNQSRADNAAKQAKLFTASMGEYVSLQMPGCYPAGAQLPAQKEPTLMYSLDAVVTPLREQVAVQTEILRHSLLVFSRGEGFSSRSEAERLNFLLLMWLFKPELQDRYKAPNIIFFDFPASILVNRVIEANQAQRDCGWAIYCKHTGSCWAKSLLSAASDEIIAADPSCRAESDALFELSEAADEEAFYEKAWFHVLVVVYILGWCVNWKFFMWKVFPEYIERPARTNNWWGTLFCTNCLAEVGDGEKETAPKANKQDVGAEKVLLTTIYVNGTGEFDGEYDLVQDQRPAGMPMWKWKDGGAWLFSGTSQQWFIGDEDEQELNFDCSVGNFCSASTHGGAMPHETKASHAAAKRPPDASAMLRIM